MAQPGPVLAAFAAFPGLWLGRGRLRVPGRTDRSPVARLSAMPIGCRAVRWETLRVAGGGGLDGPRFPPWVVLCGLLWSSVPHSFTALYAAFAVLLDERPLPGSNSLWEWQIGGLVKGREGVLTGCAI